MKDYPHIEPVTYQAMILLFEGKNHKTITLRTIEKGNVRVYLTASQQIS